MPHPQPSKGKLSKQRDFTAGVDRRQAGDFTTDRRVLILIAMAIVVGTAGAFAADILVSLIAIVSNLVWFGHFATEMIPPWQAPRSVWTVMAPVLGGIVIGLMARFGSEKIRGHGIPEAIEAILLGGSRMSAKVAVLKPLSSAISIGTGGPFGAEGPIIMTGGAIGSLFAQFFHMSAAERKTLLVAGAAAGMTAIFGTPIAAVMLAVELLLFEWKPRSFIPVAVSACVAVCWRPLLFGAGPLFPANVASSLPWWGILLCAAMGIVSGLQSGLLTTLLYKIEDLFEKLPFHWMTWPAIGGLVVGLGGLIEPRALGVGYDIIDGLLHNQLAVSVVVSILIVKTVIWLFALSSGTSGGVLAPLLIFGGALGWLVGLVMPVGNPGFWALLGMAAMMGGTMRAPLTGTFFAVEITGDVNALVPLLTATVVAYAVTVLLLRRSILTEKIARRGQHISREYGVDPYELTRAQEIMIRKVDTLQASMTVAEACAFFAGGAQHRSYPIIDHQGIFLGLMSRSDALRWQIDEEFQEQRLADVALDGSLPTGHPEDTVGFIADLMISSDSGRIPILEPLSGRLVGLIARKDLLALRSSFRSLERDRNAFLPAPRSSVAR
ncbi:chloride channel protein [Rhizobium sp. S96]|uniref:chloride channel protein n=1 Tax=Rhizobium sp. S96 TaxID=3055140 RepID=UPI0025AB2EED|nr:chloride channel protein [Rhizobium sp. S96]MDM9623193.1 chloride channel protein [Rhizobium sp. S96]